MTPYSTAVRRYERARDLFQEAPSKARFEELRVAIRVLQESRNARNAARRVRR